MRVLVTGFEPFGDNAENSSWEVAQKVASYAIEGAAVVAERLLRQRNITQQSIVYNNI